MAWLFFSVNAFFTGFLAKRWGADDVDFFLKICFSLFFVANVACICVPMNQGFLSGFAVAQWIGMLVFLSFVKHTSGLLDALSIIIFVFNAVALFQFRAFFGM